MKKDVNSGGHTRGSDPALHEAKISTICIHGGDVDIGTDPHPSVTPVFQSTTYYYEQTASLEGMLMGKRDGYAYSRWGNPTNASLERAISTLLGGGITITTSSGMAANFAALQAAGLGKGATVLSSLEIYGNTHDIFKNHFERNGARCIFADFNDIDALTTLMQKERPSIVFFEVLTNPTLSVLDAPEIIRKAHMIGAKVVVDNTFATPYLYKPFLDGADYETHSLTKYLNGHGDVLGGSITCRLEEFSNLEFIVCTQGAVLSPDAARLISRGLNTFALRMRQHCSNAKILASYLSKHTKIENLRFPGLSSHPSHLLAHRLFRNEEYGGMISFDLAGGTKDEAFSFIDSLALITSAGSLGDVKSLIVHPSSTTHHGLSADQKRRIGISESTLRLSVGIEDSEDLILDISAALEAQYGRDQSKPKTTKEKPHE